MFPSIWGDGNNGAFKHMTKKPVYEGFGAGEGDAGFLGWITGEPGGAHTSLYPRWPWRLGHRNLIQEHSVDRSKFKMNLESQVQN